MGFQWGRQPVPAFSLYRRTVVAGVDTHVPGRPVPDPHDLADKEGRNTSYAS